MPDQNDQPTDTPTGVRQAVDRAERAVVGLQGRLVAGRYRLDEIVGAGGMGRVWRAEDTVLRRPVAVKEFRSDGIDAAERSTLHARLIREAQAAAQLTHPNAIVVHDVVMDDDRPWVVMELAEADDLGRLVRNFGPLPPDAVAAIGLRLLDALEAAHRAGIVHRDVKPSNVLVGSDDQVKLTDFGAATIQGATRLTVTGGIIGTLVYMAPEQIEHSSRAPAVDLWALGATLYHVVEGTPPFDPELNVFALLNAVCTDDPRPPVRAGGLTPVLHGLFDRDPDRRLSGARLRAMLAAAATGADPDEVTAAGAAALTEAVDERTPPPAGHTVPMTPTSGVAVPPAVGEVDVAAARKQDALADTPAGPPAAGPPAAGPPAAGPVSQAPGFPAPAPVGPEPAAPRRRGMAVLLVLTLVGAVTIAAVALAGPLVDFVSGGPPAADTRPPITSPQTSTPTTYGENPAGPATTATTGAEPYLPNGWVVFGDPTGTYTVAHPIDWQVQNPIPDNHRFRAPDDAAWLQAGTVDRAGTPLDVLTQVEEEYLADRPRQDYTRVTLEPMVSNGRDAAVWEFTETVEGLPVRIRNVYVRDGDRLYGLLLRAPAASWDAQGPRFDEFERSFSPTATSG